VKGPAGRSGRPGAVPDRRSGAARHVSEAASGRHALDRYAGHVRDARDRHRLAHARPRRGHDLRAVQLDDRDRDGAGRIAAPDGGSAAPRARTSIISTTAGRIRAAMMSLTVPAHLRRRGIRRAPSVPPPGRVAHIKLPGDPVAGRRRVAVLEVGHEDPHATVQCVEGQLAIGRAGDPDPEIGPGPAGPPASRPAARPSSRPGIRAASPRPARRRGSPGTRAAPRGAARTSRAAPPAARALRRSARARSHLARTRRPRRRERSGHCSCDTRLRPAYGSRRNGGTP
jgi:hypothetical protein